MGYFVVLLDTAFFLKRSLDAISLGRVCLSMIALAGTLLLLAACLDISVSVSEADHVSDLNMS